jgi:hypothetical protein
VIRNEDGSFRIWYASRKKPPFVNKYFAINTATWSGPAIEVPSPNREQVNAPNGATSAVEFTKWQDLKRLELQTMLGLPQQRVPLDAEKPLRLRLFDCPNDSRYAAVREFPP